MADQLGNDYEDFETGHSTSLQGGHVWWRNIISRDRARIINDVHKHAEAYQRRGYAIELQVSSNRSNADLRVRFPDDAEVTEADIEILKGAMAATEVKAGWGGPGIILLFFALQSLLAGSGLA